jgi:hypothetical protein
LDTRHHWCQKSPASEPQLGQYQLPTLAADTTYGNGALLQWLDDRAVLYAPAYGLLADFIGAVGVSDL